MIDSIMDSKQFDRFLSENCVKPSWVYVHPKIYSRRDFRRLLRFTNYLKNKKYVKNLRRLHE